MLERWRNSKSIGILSKLRIQVWWCKFKRLLKLGNDFFISIFYFHIPSFTDIIIYIRIMTSLLLLFSFFRSFAYRYSHSSVLFHTTFGSLLEPLFSMITPSSLFFLSVIQLSLPLTSFLYATSCDYSVHLSWIGNN